MVYDAIIIGHGPAGLTAAKYLKRANKNVLAIGKDLGVLENEKIIIENYYGHKKTHGKDIATTAYNHAKDLGVDLLIDEVLDIDYGNGGYIVTTNDNNYHGKTILLATGAKRTQINIPGFKKYDGKGISYCVTCDGFFYKDKKVALIGSNNYMLHELSDLKNVTNNIIIFTNGIPLGYDIEETTVIDQIKEIRGNDDKVTEIITVSNSYNIDGIFVAIGSPSALEFAKKLGVIIENSKVVVDENLETNVHGIFAAGDVIGGKMQIIKASYDGMVAAHSIIDYLKTKN